MSRIYENNSVVIEIERIDELESKVNFNGDNLIWISNEEAEQFEKDLCEVLNKYRI